MKSWFQQRPPLPVNTAHELALDLAAADARVEQLQEQLEEARITIDRLNRDNTLSSQKLWALLDRVVVPVESAPPVVHVHTVAAPAPAAPAPVEHARPPDLYKVLYQPKTQSAIRAFAGDNKALASQLHAAAMDLIANDPTITDELLALRITEGETPDMALFDAEDRIIDHIIPSGE